MVESKEINEIKSKFDELTKRVEKLSSDRKKLVDCLTWVRIKLTKDEILLYDLVKEVGKTLQAVNENGGGTNENSKET